MDWPSELPLVISIFTHPYIRKYIIPQVFCLYWSVYRYSYEVFEIFPTKASPRFKSLGRISFRSDHLLDFTSVCGNIMVIVHGPFIKVWNFLEDKWATWNTARKYRPSMQVILFLVVLLMLAYRCVDPGLRRNNLPRTWTRAVSLGHTHPVPKRGHTFVWAWTSLRVQTSSVHPFPKLTSP